MQTAQGSVRESLQAVQTFSTTTPRSIADAVKTRAWQEVDDAIVQLTTHAEDQQ